MKTLKTTLVVITTALLALALLASPSSAATGVDDQATVSGSLNPWDDASGSAINPPPTTFDTGQVVRLQANFNGGKRTVRLYKVGSSTAVASATANSSGNAYFNYTVAQGQQQLFAEDSAGLETETDTYTGSPPAPSEATLDRTDTLGKSWKASFDPTVNGQSTRLEVREVCTYETDETNPETGTFDKDQPQEDCKGPWRTIATGKQNSSGDTTFTLADKLEVKHTYRATSGSGHTPEVAFQPPFTQDNPYGISTGVSEVHFNTYEGDTVNTRDRYFEGEFSMTSSSKAMDIDGPGGNAPATCATATNQMQSAMKGRGNYSWTFPKKSFTLKLADAASLCGLDSSKKYALVANDFDKSLLRNSLASYVGQKFNGIGWSPRMVPVDFYMNGSYRGSYSLVERIAIEGGKLDIKELNGDDDEEQVEPKISGGYVLEWDFRKGADYNVNLGSDSGYVGVKEPENDYDREGDNTGEGISSAQKNYISDYLNKVDNSLRSGPAWDTYIDWDSAVDYYIAMEYMKPVDGNMWASVYMYKPRGEKLHFGPLWDFDLAAGSATRAGNVASSSSFYLKNNLGVSAQQDTSNGKTWFNRLNEYPSFRAAVAQRWAQIQGQLNVTGYIDGQSSILSQSANANFQKWSHGSRISEYQVIKANWAADVSYLRGWASGRKSWLNGSSGF
jgi:CotH kinase protein